MDMIEYNKNIEKKIIDRLELYVSTGVELVTNYSFTYEDLEVMLIPETKKISFVNQYNKETIFSIFVSNRLASLIEYLCLAGIGELKDSNNIIFDNEIHDCLQEVFDIKMLDLDCFLNIENIISNGKINKDTFRAKNSYLNRLQLFINGENYELFYIDYRVDKELNNVDNVLRGLIKYPEYMKKEINNDKKEEYYINDKRKSTKINIKIKKEDIKEDNSILQNIIENLNVKSISYFDEINIEII
jgi:hypothetical protein